MSLYQKNLKREIQHLKDSIKRNNENKKIIKNELYSGENIISFKAHRIRLINLTFHSIRLKEKNRKSQKVSSLSQQKQPTLNNNGIIKF